MDDHSTVLQSTKPLIKGGATNIDTNQIFKEPLIFVESSGKNDGFSPAQDVVDTLKKRVLSKLTRRKRQSLIGLEEEYEQLSHLLQQTVAAGEGNSMFIIGARGSGKTTVRYPQSKRLYIVSHNSQLIETALSDLATLYGPDFQVVRLSGFLQTDERTAIREVWRQLGADDPSKSHKFKTLNFADTLLSILAILSHPDELDIPSLENVCNTKDEVKTTMSVVFVLDEIDQFAAHPRQTLLYNLLDIAQSKKAPIAVIGLTCKVDAVHLLEKRVKSRFSHRSIHLRLPSDLTGYWEISKAGLTVPLEEATNTELLYYFQKWNNYVDVGALTATHGADTLLLGQSIEARGLLVNNLPLIQTGREP